MGILGNRIKKERTNLGLSREDLAKKLDVSYSAIAMYEQGKREPSYSLIKKICEVFNCSIDYIIGATDLKTPQDLSTTADIEKYYQNKTNSLLKNKYVNEFLKLNLTEYETQRLISLISNEDNQSNFNYATLLNNLFIELSSHLSTKDINKVKDLIGMFMQEKLDIMKEDINLEISQQKKFEENMKKMHFDKLHPYLSSKKNATLEDNASAVLEYIEKNNIDDFSLIPVLGKIAAGQPILAEEYIEGYLPVDPNIYGMSTTEDLFYLRVSGESMNKKVKNGDYALIHKQDYAKNGDIVVAIVNGDDEATLKRYKRLNEQFILLEPMSSDPSIEAITVDLKDTNFKIIGKAIGQFGKF